MPVEHCASKMQSDQKKEEEDAVNQFRRFAESKIANQNVFAIQMLHSALKENQHDQLITFIGHNRLIYLLSYYLSSANAMLVLQVYQLIDGLFELAGPCLEMQLKQLICTGKQHCDSVGQLLSSIFPANTLHKMLVWTLIGELPPELFIRTTRRLQSQYSKHPEVLMSIVLQISRLQACFEAFQKSDKLREFVKTALDNYRGPISDNYIEACLNSYISTTKTTHLSVMIDLSVAQTLNCLSESSQMLLKLLYWFLEYAITSTRGRLSGEYQEKLKSLVLSDDCESICDSLPPRYSTPLPEIVSLLHSQDAHKCNLEIELLNIMILEENRSDASKCNLDLTQPHADNYNNLLISLENRSVIADMFILFLAAKSSRPDLLMQCLPCISDQNWKLKLSAIRKIILAVTTVNEDESLEKCSREDKAESYAMLYDELISIMSQVAGEKDECDNDNVQKATGLKDMLMLPLRFIYTSFGEGKRPYFNSTESKNFIMQAVLDTFLNCRQCRLATRPEGQPVFNKSCDLSDLVTLSVYVGLFEDFESIRRQELFGELMKSLRKNMDQNLGVLKFNLDSTHLNDGIIAEFINQFENVCYTDVHVALTLLLLMTVSELWLERILSYHPSTIIYLAITCEDLVNQVPALDTLHNANILDKLLDLPQIPESIAKLIVCYIGKEFWKKNPAGFLHKKFLRLSKSIIV